MTVSIPPRKTRLGRRIKKVLSRVAVRLASWLIPPFYNLYMWFVFVTSRVERINGDLVWQLRHRYGGFVGVLWHEEVSMVAYGFRRYEPHTLASVSDFGDVIARMLKLNGFVVFRGGSSKQRAKRKVLPDMIKHMQEDPGVIYGITCDGSKGPAYKLKIGSVRIAHACSKPMITARTWCKRRFTWSSSWDRAVLPLPFNHIVQVFTGPYFVPVEGDDPAVREEFRQFMENELLELTWWVHERIGDLPPEPRHGFPEGWRPSWGGELPTPSFEPEAPHPALRLTGAEPMSWGAKRRQRAAIKRAAIKRAAS